MTKEQLFEEIDEIYGEWHGGELHIGAERTERIKEVLNKAINYNRCCKSDSEQLKCNCDIKTSTDYMILGYNKCPECGNTF